jgi:hypothetical protein
MLTSNSNHSSLDDGDIKNILEDVSQAKAAQKRAETELRRATMILESLEEKMATLNMSTTSGK